MFTTHNSNSSLHDIVQMDARIRQRPTISEVIGFALGLGMVLVFLNVNPPSLGFDLKIYLRAAHGDFHGYYYAYWVLPFFGILNYLPFTISYFLWAMLCIFSVTYALRVFGGFSLAVLTSYQMFYILYQGQYTGPVIGALALLWWSLNHRRWNIAGIALVIAAAKYQTGLTVGLILLVCAHISWKERLHVFAIPVLVGLLSLLVYPTWPIHAMENIQSAPPNANGSLSLWRWLGPYALLLWLPIFSKVVRREMFPIAIIATMMITLPYFQQADIIVLFVLPVAWLPFLGNVGYFGGYSVLQSLFILPLMIYIETTLRAIKLTINRTHIYSGSTLGT
jgi:hypothetical protein